VFGEIDHFKDNQAGRWAGSQSGRQLGKHGIGSAYNMAKMQKLACEGKLVITD